MSQANVEILRGAVDAWNRDDIEALAELFAPDAIWYPLTYWPDSQICHGREEIERLVRSAREPLERNEAAVEKLV
jgi:ketosteroid isomerase-like protein